MRTRCFSPIHARNSQIHEYHPLMNPHSPAAYLCWFFLCVSLPPLPSISLLPTSTGSANKSMHCPPPTHNRRPPNNRTVSIHIHLLMRSIPHSHFRYWYENIKSKCCLWHCCLRIRLSSSSSASDFYYKYHITSMVTLTTSCVHAERTPNIAHNWMG